MRKFSHILLVLVVALLLVGCKSNNVKSISYDSFKEKIEKKESMILFFGENETLETTLNNVLNKYDLKAYRIKISNLNNDEINELRGIIDYDQDSICFIVDGSNPTVLTNITDEYITETKLETVLKNLGFIK